MKFDYMTSSELVCLWLAMFLLFLMIYTKPRITKMYMINLTGTVLSIIALLLELCISIIQKYPHKYYNRMLLDCLCFGFIVTYFAICVLLVNYVCRLSSGYRKKISFTSGLVKLGIMTTYVGLAISIFWKSGFHTCQDGDVKFIHFVEYYAIWGLLSAINAGIFTLINRKKIARPVFTYIMVSIPIEIVVLLLQFITTGRVFIGSTYVFPFLLIYILFHSNPYDFVTGCQNRDAFVARFLDYTRRKRKFWMVFIDFPQMRNVDYNTYAGNEKLISRVYAYTCRKVERFTNTVRLYKVGQGTFGIIYKEVKGESTEELLLHLRHAMNVACESVGEGIYYKMIAFHGDQQITSAQMLHTMADYVHSKLSNESENEYYIARQEDYEVFKKIYRAEQMLLEIRNKRDLDDERVLCYVQPIYSVKDGKFHTAESLMRLQLEGEIIYPDLFIPLAERNNCIHLLTCIILNKVCKNVKQLKEKYDLEAITINCSSAELSNKNFPYEIINIIKMNKVDPSSIRIELTESAMFDNFKLVYKNMKILTEWGICFYLDDFGTGYSNLERIFSCPFHTIKFDKSLLYKAMDDNGMKDLIARMLRIFREKGFHDLIEGVETDIQNAFCQENGIEFIQGYRYAEPIPIEKITTYLTTLK